MSKTKNSKKSKVQQHAKPNLKDIELREHKSIKVDEKANIEVETLNIEEKKHFEFKNLVEKKPKLGHIAFEKSHEKKSVWGRINMDFIKNINKEAILKNKKACASIAAAAVLVVTAGVFGKVAYDKHQLATRAYDIVVDGKNIGCVRDKAEVDAVLKKVKTQVSAEFGIEAAIGQKIDYIETHVDDSQVLNSEKLEKKLRDQIDVKVWAYGIEVNGKVVGYAKTEAMAWQSIEDIEKPYKAEMAKENTSIKKVELVENVQIVKEKVNLREVLDYDKLVSTLKTGSVEEKKHTIVEGESYWAIANKYKITVDQLIQANPGKNPELVQIGDELNLAIPKPYLSVATYEERKVTEKIPYEVKYNDISTMFKDEKVVLTKGQAGERKIVADIKKVNGIEVEKIIKEEQVLKSPVAEVVKRGTKAVPPERGTGRFLMPTNGQLASRYGWRTLRGSRDFHQGIDLSARIGTPVKAADGGVVTFAGWKNGYGYLVEITHGKGYKTRYAHNSKIYVKKGDKVYQGKVISAVGNTGRSTGPHLHFEVWKNGATQNPSSYINKSYK